MTAPLRTTTARDDVAELVERHLEAGTDVTEIVASLMHAAANLTAAMVGGDEGMGPRVGDAALSAMRAETLRKVGVA